MKNIYGEPCEGFENEIAKKAVDSLSEKDYFIADNDQTTTDILTGSIAQEPIPTGIKPLDDYTGGFYPNNLIVLGAIPSLGKTSLINQIACHIAQTRPVLFVTIEEPTTAMFAQIFARLSYELNPASPIEKEAILNPKVRTDAQQKVLKDAIKAFYPTSKNLYFMQSTEQPSVRDIRKAAVSVSTVQGQSPVIFIDYLQLLKAPHKRDIDKSAIDKNISALKRLAAELNTPIIVNSSLNRESYHTILGLGSFKETGGIEYGADLLLTLQVAGLDNDMRKYEIEKEVERCKEKTVRELKLNILKNRHGKVNSEGFDLTFNTTYNLFTPPVGRSRKVICY